MLKKLLKSRAPAPAPTVPPGQRVYAVGDVHGCLDQLERLLVMIDADDRARPPARTMLVFLGDLVDRGPDSKGVVEAVRRRAAEGPDVRLLLGNHEELFLASLDGDLQALKLFCRVGGRETALSYGISAADYDRAGYEDLAAMLAEAVPAEHRAFLASGTEMEIAGDYAFVHAGVHPRRTLGEQRGSDLRWIRDTFLDHGKRLEKMIVHGHTISEAIEYRPHRIGIDTGAYMSGKLTALGLEDDRTWSLDTAEG